MLTAKQLQVYIQLNVEARQKGFTSYQDKREFETGNKEELKEIREIQKQIDSYKKDHNNKDKVNY